MKKKDHKRTSINIETNLYLMAVSEGIDFTAFFNRCLALFFEVPEDPRQKLVKEKSEYTVLRLKEKYHKEISEIIQDQKAQSCIQDREKSKDQELIKFGEYLKTSSAYPVLVKCLERKDFDDDTLSIVTMDMNRNNGNHYEPEQVWNMAIDWYRKYGATSWSVRTSQRTH